MLTTPTGRVTVLFRYCAYGRIFQYHFLFAVVRLYISFSSFKTCFLFAAYCFLDTVCHGRMGCVLVKCLFGVFISFNHLIKSTRHTAIKIVMIVHINMCLSPFQTMIYCHCSRRRFYILWFYNRCFSYCLPYQIFIHYHISDLMAILILIFSEKK